MKVIYLSLAITLLQTIHANSQHTDLYVDVKPKSFKINIPFEINNRGIIIKTYWGADKAQNDLLWDNNSPSWANEMIITNTRSVTRSKNFAYSTTTASGTPIYGDVYNCDSISVGQVTFVNVPLYEISDPMKGVFGINLISKGFWEINFKKREMIFASSIDSLKDLSQTEPFSSNFNNDEIKVPLKFRNNVVEDVELDFGYNGSILLPTSDFLQITRGYINLIKRDLRFSTPGNNSDLENTLAFDTVRINKHAFKTVIYTNKLATEKLIGLAFFEPFEFVIFDYRNKLVYVSIQRD